MKKKKIQAIGHEWLQGKGTTSEETLGGVLV